MAEGRFAEAAQAYEGLAKALPGDPGLQLNLGMARHLAGDYAGSLAPLQTALRAQPSLPPALIMLGGSYLHLGRPAEALPHLRKAAALDPKQLDVRRMLADAASAVGRNEEAAAALRALTAADPNDPRAWQALGTQYEALAGQAFEALQQTAPDSAHLLALLAESRTRGSQNRAAFYLYREALAKEPKLRGVRTSVAEIYRATGHNDWAEQELKAEAALGKPDCLREKAVCEWNAGRFLQAAAAAKLSRTPAGLYWRTKAWNSLASEAYAKLLALPDSAPKLQFTAELLRNQGKYVESVAQWRAALALSAGDPRLEAELAQTLVLAKDFAAADPLLDKLLAADPGSPELNLLRGDAWLEQQQAEKAIPYLEKAVAADAAMLPACASLARAYLAAGQGQKAVPHLKAALPLDDDGSLHFQLARAYQAAGQAELAKQLLAKYQELKRRSEQAQEQLERDAQITAPQ